MSQADYESVLDRMRLQDGTLWPIPVTLDVSEEVGSRLSSGAQLALRDPEGVMLAALEVSDVWEPDRRLEDARVLGGVQHPAAQQISRRSYPICVGGQLRGIQLPTHYDFRSLRFTPMQLRDELQERGWRRVIAFHAVGPIHGAQQEFTARVATDLGAGLLIHAVMGPTGLDRIDHFTRVRCYQAILERYPHADAHLALLNLAMRVGGPREALWRAIVSRNHGCTHFLLAESGSAGRSDGTGTSSENWEIVERIQEAVGLEVIMLDERPSGEAARSFGVAELGDLSVDERELQEWFTFPDVEREIRRTYPPKGQRGFTVFFTGLSGSGKSTVANVLRVKLLEIGGRSVTLLDGDLVRRHLSSELGFSKAHRDLNVLRIGFVASEITKAGGVAVCAPIAPYDGARQANSRLISEAGGYFLVHVSTPLSVCEARDRKGLYAKARAGLIQEFTGISDPYEVPKDADITIDTSSLRPDAAAEEIIMHLRREGYLALELH